MAKQKDETTRVTYSVRLNPDLLKVLRHIAVDEHRSVGELLEEGIKAVMKKRKVSTGYTLHDKSIKDGADIDTDRYEIPEFLRKHSDK